MNQPFRVLILEDRDVDAELMVRELHQAGLGCTVTRVWTETDFEDGLRHFAPDIILADYTLPAYDGLSALKVAARETPDTPFILVSGSLGEDVAIDALHHGATDYVLKQRLTRLGPAVVRALREADERRLRREEEHRRREAEQDIRRLSREWERIFQAIGHPTLILDPDHRVLAANWAMLKATGRTADDLRGAKCFEVLHDPDATSPPHDCPMERMRLTGRLTTGELEVQALGGYYWISCTPVAGDDGEIERVIHIATDITERKRAESALRESEERFKSIFDNVTDGILLVDPDTGCFAMANLTIAAMLGCLRGDVLALGTRDIYEAADLPQVEHACRSTATESLVIHDLPITRRDGSKFFADVNTAPVVITGRRLVMMNVRDVTERRTLQASVAQADRLASMGMLAAGVAHEINNPLSYVVYGLETLVEELPKLVSGRPGHDDLIQCAVESLGGTMRIKEIARSLSTFSRTASDEPTAVDLTHVIECAAGMARNEVKYRARLVKDLAPVPRVLASEGRLSQVFLNLLINAAQAVPEGHPDAQTITIRTTLADGMVVADVADTGKGIAPGDLERVFEPFFTTKAPGEGTGLGLAISRNIVRGFGGDITVSSTPGIGATFTVRLPAAPAAFGEGRQGTVSTPIQPDATPRGRLLIVDDEAAMRRMLARQFEGHCVVVTATSGSEAQRIVEAHPPFDAVLCDVMMPDMTGTDLHEWAASAHPALASRFVFMTGGAFTPRSAEYLASVPNPRLEKPVETRRLRAEVLRIMHHAGRAASAAGEDQ